MSPISVAFSRYGSHKIFSHSSFAFIHYRDKDIISGSMLLFGYGEEAKRDTGYQPFPTSAFCSHYGKADLS